MWQELTPCLLLLLSGLSFIMADFQAEVLEFHNKCRELHQADPLVISPYLEKEAVKIAKFIASRGHLLQSPNESYGVTMDRWEDVLDPMNCVEFWYYENRMYNYRAPKITPSTKRFTQMVWKFTKQMGAAVEEGTRGTYVVVTYFPKGNIPSMLSLNVSPKLSYNENATSHWSQLFMT